MLGAPGLARWPLEPDADNAVICLNPEFSRNTELKIGETNLSSEEAKAVSQPEGTRRGAAVSVATKKPHALWLLRADDGARTLDLLHGNPPCAATACSAVHENRMNSRSEQDQRAATLHGVTLVCGPTLAVALAIQSLSRSDLVMLARLSQALARARAVPLAA
jgi:hypothetical protein